MKKNSEKIALPESITVKEFAKRLDKSVSDTITILMDNGFLVTINEELDYDTAAIIAEDLGFQVKKEKKRKKEAGPKDFSNFPALLKKELKKTSSRLLKRRPPVVTILGHVDHGKTTLLDTIRRTKVAESESGGITQHITAYQVKVKKKIITFVDTPGHEAFQKMRSRGANVADIAVIIIAADDGVKPQTKEVLDYVKSTGIPFIICLNKIDKPEANVDKVKGKLAELDVLVEGWGGKIPVVEISAKQNKNIDELLETIILVDDIEEFKADYSRPALGLVLESHLDKKRGPVATIIGKNGIIQKGDLVSTENAIGKVKSLENFQGGKISEATPSLPVTVLGFTKLPAAGSIVQVLESKTLKKSKGRDFASRTSSGGRASALKRIEKTLEKEKYQKLNIVLKADTQGSLEAIIQILENLVVDNVIIKIVKSGVGQITESDILFAQISRAIPYGFRVTNTSTASQVQIKEKIEVRFFEVIYHLIEDIQKEMKKIVATEKIRLDHGVLKVLAIFHTGKKDMIVGGKVVQGKLCRADEFEIVRNEEIIGRGVVAQMKKGKTEAIEAEEGEECGITYEAAGPLIKIQIGDKLNSYAYAEQAISVT
jgi:translation initiation factor IF-2